MSDLKAQLVDYLEHVVQRVDASDVIVEHRTRSDFAGVQPQFEEDEQRGEDLTDSIFPESGDNTAQHETRRWIGVAAAVTVLVVAGALVVANGDRRENAGTPAFQPSLAEPSALPSAAILGWESRWSRVPHSEAIFGEGFEQAMSSVAAGGPGLVAVGQAGAAAPAAAVWTSVDGITWSRAPHDEAIFGGAVMTSVTAGGPGLVAVGGAFDEIEPGTDAAAVWTSPDGITWSLVPHDDAVFGGAAMTSVTTGGPGLVAVGWDGHPHGADSNAVVWTSVDGVTWSRVPHDEAIFGGATGAWMWSVASAGPGLVAVGDAVWAGGSGAAVWTSPDGLVWSRVPHDDLIFGNGGMRSVSTGGPGVVAVGTADDDAAVWTSPDGLVWSRVPHDEAIFGGPVDQAMTSMTAAGPALVAVGFDGVNDYSRGGGGDHLDAAVWTSVDGITWSRAAHDLEAFGAGPKPVLEMSSVIAGGPGLVAVGANRVYDTFGATGSDAAVLVGTFEICSDGTCTSNVTDQTGRSVGTAYESLG